jgi:hypothetical protein
VYQLERNKETDRLRVQGYTQSKKLLSLLKVNLQQAKLAYLGSHARGITDKGLCTLIWKDVIILAKKL